MDDSKHSQAGRPALQSAGIFDRGARGPGEESDPRVTTELPTLEFVATRSKDRRQWLTEHGQQADADLTRDLAVGRRIRRAKNAFQQMETPFQ